MNTNHNQDLSKLVDSILVPHHAFATATKTLEQCYRVMKGGNDPIGLAIVGESRTGKSRALEDFERAYPPERTPEGLHVPFLRAKVPAKPTVKGLATLLLYALRDPKYDKGTEVDKTLRLQRLMRQVGTVILALDEFQHFEDKTTHRVQHEVADWLKVLVDEAKIGLVVTGLPSSMAVIRQNEQLAGRFLAPVLMPRFRWREGEDRAEFAAFLDALQSALDPFQFPELGSEEMAFRMYCASGGLIGYVIKILKKATWNAIDAGHYAIGLDMLADAYKQAVIVDEIQALAMPNPFASGFPHTEMDILLTQVQSIGVRMEEVLPKRHRSK